MNVFSSIYAKLVLMTLIIVALVFMIKLSGMDNILHNQVWNMIIFFFLLAFSTGYLSQLILKNGKDNFVAAVLSGTIFRFFISLGYILVFLFLGVDNIILFVVNFFVIYLLYLLFDIYGLIANLRPHSK